MLAPALDRMHSTHPHSLPGTHYSDAEGVVDYVTELLEPESGGINAPLPFAAITFRATRDKTAGPTLCCLFVPSVGSNTLERCMFVFWSCMF